MIKQWIGLLIIGWFIMQNILYANNDVESSATIFNIKEKELLSYIDKAYKGDLNSIHKLMDYYTFSKTNTGKEFKWFKVAIKLYDKTALYNYLKYINENNKDVQEVISWLESEANKNNAFAQRELAYIYQEGEFVDKNLTKSNNWLKELKNNLSKGL